MNTLSRVLGRLIEQVQCLMKKSENVAKRVISLCCTITFFHYFEVKQGENDQTFLGCFCFLIFETCREKA